MELEYQREERKEREREREMKTGREKYVDEATWTTERSRDDV